jgi:broad specificity phosphatase PhoE
MKKNWPRQIWIVRHGESAGNVARDAADLAGLPRIEIAERDVGVPLSAVGRQQFETLGGWFRDLPSSQRPNGIIASPYKRAMGTAQIISGQLSGPVRIEVSADRQADVPNCGVTEYVARTDEAGLVLKRYNFVAPLVEAGTPVTAQEDANVAAR